MTNRSKEPPIRWLNLRPAPSWWRHPITWWRRRQLRKDLVAKLNGDERGILMLPPPSAPRPRRELTVTITALDQATMGLRRMTRALDRFAQTVAEARESARIFIKSALMKPDEIKLYAWCRVKTDPRVPLAYQGQHFSLEDGGWYCDVGLYEPVFVSVEEYWR